MTSEDAKASALAKVQELVERFRSNEGDYLRPTFNETQARTEYITPLLEAFGWDVHNLQRQPLGLREVIEEATVEVSEERLSKRPDYELRVARQRKLFVEAKKPSVHIDRDGSSAFQVRRYGYSASLPISILTNFHQLAIYDCQPVPADTDHARVARIRILGYGEYVDNFDLLWETLSRDAVFSGDFDRKHAVGSTRRGSDQFDDLFLRQVQKWRELLAVDIHRNCPDLTVDELTYAVQLFLSRIVFLRICEDRDIEKYETLRTLDATDTFGGLMTELRRADGFYDSGIFRLLDDDRLGIRISDETLQAIIAELYYPKSPYTFSVVETEVLGQIYEQFLGEVITVTDSGIEVVNKPEVRESGGVVPTPQYVVDSIIQRTLATALEGKAPEDLRDFTVADICCGSGIFLLSAYEALMEHHLAWYLADNREAHTGREIYEVGENQWRLTLEEKRRLLLEHIRGVDIDSNAVEVARFSLLLKLIEGETAEGMGDYVATSGNPALPELDRIVRCGNSLVSEQEWASALGPMPGSLVAEVNPLEWSNEFPNEMGNGGFSVLVGNPPYIRIQNMATYSPEEVRFYQNAGSPYSTARQDNFDKYALFVERALSLLHPSGRLGFIVPHKFMSIQSGRTLRHLIASERQLEQIVHFGVKQVFGAGTSNYTCILVFDRNGGDQVTFEQVGPLEEWRYGQLGQIDQLPIVELTDDPWQFASKEASAVFSHIRRSAPTTLAQVAEIFVGVQTSADDIYIFESADEDVDSVTLRWNGSDWPIERGILRPCLHDVTLFAYEPPQANAWMIFPYELIPGQSRVEAHLIQPTEFANKYPGCWSYLKARRTELEQRNIVGGRANERQWYQFGRSQSLTKFDGPKIVLPILSIEPRYSYDDTNVVVTGGGNGPYYMIRPLPDSAVSNYYLLAVLNHPASEAMVRTNTSAFRGGYYSHGKQFIENLPVPVPADEDRDRIEQNVRLLITTLQDVRSARTPQERLVSERRADELRRGIENQVSELFALDANQIDVIRSVPIPT